jgi:hypothetical protein
VRIPVGGPAVNAWTARLLAALGPPAAGLAARVAAGAAAPLWIPAARSRSEVFTAGADVRGERDLPVLIVAGADLTAAVAALTADLGDAVAEAELAAEAGAAAGPVVLRLPDRLRARHSVALLNQGTPSGLVTPDGTLHITLMRGSSAWPCGVWIDGPRRTAPDGSSFAWQHWSHTFRYALVAGPGDWREAGFARAGQEYNHDLIVSVTGQHDGPLPPAASLAEVTTPPSGRPAMLSALKPAGNPLASGRPGAPSPGVGVTVRLRDGGSLPAAPAVAQVSLPGGISGARLTDVTERPIGQPAEAAAGRAVVTVPPAGMATLCVKTGAAAEGSAAQGSAADGAAATGRAGTEPGALRGRAQPGAALPGGGEPDRPVFTRYWLHGTGPAPLGNLPVTVHLSPGRVALPVPGTPAGGPGSPPPTARLRLTVACGPAGAAGRAALDVPPGLAVAGPDGAPAGPFGYCLPPGGHAHWDLSVQARPGLGPGRYFLAACITDELGQLLEDAVLVTAGETPPPSPGAPPANLETWLAADRRAQAGEAEVALSPGSLVLPPGGRATLTVRVANRTASQIRGAAQLLSPFGNWQEIRPWARGFSAAPGEAAELEYPVALPGEARPGTQWWALAKVTYFGRVSYTGCAEIRVTG